MIAEIFLKRKEFIYQLLLILIIAFLYSFSWNYPMFAWDDHTYILKNPNLGLSLSNIYLFFSKPYFYLYTPLTMLSYMFDYNIWGLNSFGYHLQNIFWHIVATIAIYKCFRLFEIKSWIAFFLCLIFAVHPQRIESVVWLSERKDVLCAAFYFLSILFFLKYSTKKNKKNLILSVLFYIFALLSKPMAVSLPFILLFYMFHKKRTLNLTEYFNKLWPFFALLLLFLPLTFYAQSVDDDRFMLVRQLYIILYNIKFYFVTTIFPISLNPIYPRIVITSSIVNTIVFYASTIFLIFFLFTKNRILFIYSILPLLFCFLVSLAPIIGMVPFASFEHTDRWSYIPSIFIWFPVGLILTKALSRNKAEIRPRSFSFLLSSKFIFILLFIYSIVLIVSNYQYQKKWKDKHTLFSYSANIYPRSTVPLLFLAEIELEKKNFGAVLGIAEELNLSTENSLFGYFYKAAVLFHTNRKEAIKLLLYIKPHCKSQVFYLSYHKRILKLLIKHYFSIGDIQKTIKYIDELLKEQGLTKFNLAYYQGTKAYCEKDYKTAIYWLEKAQKLQPENKNIQGNIKACLKLQKEKLL